MAANKIETLVTMNGIYSYERSAYGRYGTEKAYIYKMVDENGKVYVWKTTSFMGLEVEDENGHFTARNGKTYEFYKINKGDVIRIKATVKGESEYNGEAQTEVNRVKVLERTFKAKTWEEVQAEKKAVKERKAEEQRNSLRGADFIWEMPYRQYKESYSDCETLEGSYNDHREENERSRHRIPATICVIIREGRMKNSGVRGEHYSGYEMTNENGEKITYRAVKEENALKRVSKDFPEYVWKCTHIYNYR